LATEMGSALQVGLVLGLHTAGHRLNTKPKVPYRRTNIGHPQKAAGTPQFRVGLHNRARINPCHNIGEHRRMSENAEGWQTASAATPDDDDDDDWWSIDSNLVSRTVFEMLSLKH